MSEIAPIEDNIFKKINSNGVEFEKYVTLNKAHCYKARTYLESAENENSYVDENLLDTAKKKSSVIENLSSAKIVSKNVEDDITSTKYYRNFNTKKFTVISGSDATCLSLSTIIESLISNIEEATVYRVPVEAYEKKGYNISFGITTNIKIFMSDMKFLCKLDENVDYSSSNITEFGVITKFIISFCQSEASKHQSQQLKLSRSFYERLRPIAGLESDNLTIKAIVMMTHLIYHIMKNDDADLCKYLKYLKTEKKVNLGNFRRNLSDLKGTQLILLHEWNIVLSDEEILFLEDQFTDYRFKDILAEQKKLLSKYRKGDDVKDSLININKRIKDDVDDNILGLIYERQSALHSYIKNKPDVYKDNKAGKKTRVSKTPSRKEWREWCQKEKNNHFLCEATLIFMCESLIKSQSEMATIIETGIPIGGNLYYKKDALIDHPLQKVYENLQDIIKPDQDQLDQLRAFEWIYSRFLT